MKLLKIVVPLLFAAVAGIFLLAPAVYMQSFLDGLTVWAVNILPALFPFAVLSTLSLKFFPTPKRSFCRALFGVECDAMLLTSLLCGYPVGAKIIAESSFDSQASTQICSFLSSPGPIFLVATVGEKLLKSNAAATILLVANLLATVMNGLIYRKKLAVAPPPLPKFSAKDVGDAVTSSVLSVLSVGGLVALFFMLFEMIKNLLPTISNSLPLCFVIGLLEMTNGVISLSALCDVQAATVLCGFLTAFGGLCVFVQSIAFLGTKGVSAAKFLQMKLTQASICSLLCFAGAKLFL